MRYFRLSSLILCILLAVVCGYFFILPGFRLEDVTSDEPYRIAWDLDPPHPKDLVDVAAILNQPFSFLGEGGQSYAFESSDGRYVLKLFKFRRFRPVPFVNKLPDIAPFSSYRHRHIVKRHRKLETAFEGYRVAYSFNKESSGLLFVQLNSLSEPLLVKLSDSKGKFINADLQHVPFVLQLKGETLEQTLNRLLTKGNLEAVQECLDKLFALYRSEYSNGLIDADRGIMHNIGVIDDTRLFHLDVGKLTYRLEMKSPKMQQQELRQITSKLRRWLQLNFPAYGKVLEHHLSKLQEAHNAAFN